MGMRRGVLEMTGKATMRNKVKHYMCACAFESVNVSSM